MRLTSLRFANTSPVLTGNCQVKVFIRDILICKKVQTRLFLARLRCTQMFSLRHLFFVGTGQCTQCFQFFLLYWTKMFLQISL